MAAQAATSVRGQTQEEETNGEDVAADLSGSETNSGPPEYEDDYEDDDLEGIDDDDGSDRVDGRRLWPAEADRDASSGPSGDVSEKGRKQHTELPLEGLLNTLSLAIVQATAAEAGDVAQMLALCKDLARREVERVESHRGVERRAREAEAELAKLREQMSQTNDPAMNAVGGLDEPSCQADGDERLS